jgi:DNA invertase Pin-like site-specific DNA recombinase
MIYGYARVSTDGQKVVSQVAALKAAGAGKVFQEVASGAKTDRTQLRKAIAVLGAGDVLMVTRLDRLARSTRDLLNTLATITGRKAGFRSLGDTWADTTTSHGRLMLTVLGGLAEFESDLIRARTGEGRARAVARGQKMGRPQKLTPHQQREAIKRRDHGEESLTENGRSYNVSSATISGCEDGRPSYLIRIGSVRRRKSCQQKLDVEAQLDMDSDCYRVFGSHRVGGLGAIGKSRNSKHWKRLLICSHLRIGFFAGRNIS